jgi:hypothetical protein
MHLGKFIEEEVVKQELRIIDVAKKSNKSDTAIRKDFKKEFLHQSVINVYSKILNINIYELLADELRVKKYDNPVAVNQEVNKPDVEKFQPKNTTYPEVISVIFEIPNSKRDEFLKLLSA